MSPYPNAYQIEEIFSYRTQPDKFHEYLAEPVDVMVVGEDHEIAGRYKSVQEFHDKIFARIFDTVKRETIRLEVKRVVGGGESAVCPTFLLSLSAKLHGRDDDRTRQDVAIGASKNIH